MRKQQTGLLIGQPGLPMGLAKTLRGAHACADAVSVARLGFAYVSDFGLNTLLSHVDSVPIWRTSRKEWIVGLHHGVTEPKALERIRGLPDSTLKVFAGAKRLSLSSLATGQMFHAKIIGITSGSGSSRRPVCLVASSANLTGAALSADARNYEAGLALFGSAIPAAEFKRLEEWWKHAWNESVSATDVILDQYTRLRDRFLQRNRDALAGLDPPSLSQLRDSRTLWIEAGAMSGGFRNQIEFNQDLADFFGPTQTETQFLRLHANGKKWDD